MFDARKIFDELQRQAADAAQKIEDSGAIDKAEKAASDLRTRLDEDPKTRTLAAGAGGLLLLGLLGSRGGRNLIGGVAKTGAVAALGALAYKAWSERQGAKMGTDLVAEAERAGFPVDAASDPDFALAVIRAMLASAYTDGVLDAYEQRALNGAFAKAGISEDEQRMLTNAADENETLKLITHAAKTPHHAAELYAAAVVAAGDLNDTETAFLAKLADRLGIDAAHADAIRANAHG
ncbi:MAG: DUF533 domain-containing protein [Parvularculaceae bacterium]